MRLVKILLATAIAAGVAMPVQAHHSFAMFDNTKEKVLTGTIREFQWTNPHTWIQVTVPGANGKTEEWSIEGSSPNGLTRQGWKRNSLKPGDKVSVTIHPLKNGDKGGSFVSLTFADGRKLGGRNAPPPGGYKN